MKQPALDDNTLDDLLGDFFKAQMKHPWPAAPVFHNTTTEPSVLVASIPSRAESARKRDTGSKSRYTLAASVAFLLGTCWTLSNGFQPGDSAVPGAKTTAPGVVDMNSVGASDPAALKEIRKDNAVKGNNDGFTQPRIELP